MSTTTLRPKQLLSDFMPGLRDQVEVGAAGLGTTIINTTVGMSDYTDAQLMAAKSNIETGQKAPVVILHSLRVEPSFVHAAPRLTSLQALIQVVTADTSAVYLRATAPHTGGANGGLGVAARIVVVR